MGYFTGCTAEYKNVKQDECPGFGTTAGFSVLPPDFAVADETTARLYATWETAMQAIKTERMYIVNGLMPLENQSEEVTMVDGVTGKYKVKNGLISYMFNVPSSPYRHSTLMTLEGKRSVIFWDVEGSMKGCSHDDVEFRALNCQISVGNYKPNNGTDAGMTPITISIDDINDINKYPAILSDLNFKPQNFEGLQTVDLSVVSGTIAGAVVSVVDKFSGAAALGLEAADFLIKNAGGVAQTVTSAVDNEDGTYNIVYTVTAGTYTFDLKQPKDMITKGYESSKAVSKVLA